MRRAASTLPLLLLLCACTTTRADGSGRIQTSAEANRESLQGALAAPLRDVNVLRTKIPEVLLEAEVFVPALVEACATVNARARDIARWQRA